MRPVELLRQFTDNGCPSRIRQALELAEVFVQRMTGLCPLPRRADEQGALGRLREDDLIACDGLGSRSA